MLLKLKLVYGEVLLHLSTNTFSPNMLNYELFLKNKQHLSPATDVMYEPRGQSLAN